jgi:hypothetical protein
MNDIQPYIDAMKIFEDSCSAFSEALEYLNIEYKIYSQLYDKQKYSIEKQDLEDFGQNIQLLSDTLNRCNFLIDEIYKCLYDHYIDESKIFELTSELIEKTQYISSESLNTKEIITRLRTNSNILESKVVH